jgi:sulfatase maturation enzyme AslB (radical SAM superfamily)
VFDTDTRELTPVHNPITLFQKIYYDDTVEKAEYKYRTGQLPDVTDKFVKLIVVNKSNPKLFEHFINRLQSKHIHELKIAENFEEFVGGSVEDEKVSVESTEELLSTYIEAVETPLDKQRIKQMIHELMIEAQTADIV